MPLILQKMIFREDLKSNPTVLYVFGDNEERWGLGGQAKEMRGEPNAVGIATLKAPGVFWNEEEVERQKAVLDKDMKVLFLTLGEGGTVIFPIDGVGSGLAFLKKSSPTTWDYLQRKVERLILYKARNEP